MKILQTIRTNQTLILLTFELFWIVVFLLEKISHDGVGQVPQFVYVNF